MIVIGKGTEQARFHDVRTLINIFLIFLELLNELLNASLKVCFCQWCIVRHSVHLRQ